MQGIFQKENTDKALKYGIYRHLPTYEKIIRNLVSFYIEKGSGNIKYLRLTPKGEELAAAYVAPLVQADIHSFSAFSAEERSLLLKLMQQQLTSLKEYSEQLWN